MKKLLFSLLLLLCTTVGMAQEFIEVHNFAQLKQAIINNPTAKIQLMNDIQIDGGDDAFIISEFTGVISGKYQEFNPLTDRMENTGYRIYGPDQNSKLECSWLFDNVKYARFEYIKFMNISIVADSYDDDSYVGVIARTADHTTFDHVDMNTVSVFSDNNSAGTFVGKAEECNFYSCAVLNSDINVDGRNAGGFVGQTRSCVFSTCIDCGDTGVYSDGTPADGAYAGGFSGHSIYDTFSNCRNFATVGATDDFVGGFVGYGFRTTYTVCENSGTVMHSSKSDFDKMVKDRREKSLNLTAADIERYSTEYGLTTSAIALLTTFIAVKGVWAVAAIVLADVFVSAAMAAIAATVTVAVMVAIVVAIAVGVVYAIYSVAAHDDVGGICGRAYGGSFESCINRGQIKCVDERLGGIVGVGNGVTINNCLNLGEIDYSICTDHGSIIGAAYEWDDKLCKITNCLSINKDKMVGVETGVDPASGNNFCVDLGNNETCKWEKTITLKELKSGLVANYLNNYGDGKDIWRQNLRTHDDKVIDQYPVPEATHDVVNVENRAISGMAISTPRDLLDFAKLVNEGDKDQFASAYLTSDIDMSGYGYWTPIGSDDSFSQWRGAFDGRGHTIKNLKVNISAAAGLFGVAHVGAEICNVIIGEGSEITSSGNAGAAGILGEVKIGWDWGYVRIENCANYGRVTALQTVNAGGILGLVDNSISDNVKVYVTNCYNMGTITAENGNSALLCGYMRNSGVVSNCWSGGQLRTSSSQYPFDANQRSEQELLVGYWEKCDITNCYTIDAVTNVDQWKSYYHQEGVTDLNNSGVLASGELTYILNGMNNDPTQSHYWQQNLGTDLVPAFGDRGFFHERTLIKKDYGTVCVPYKLKSKTDVHKSEVIEYYTFKEVKTEDGQVSLCFQYADEVEPGTPALYHLYMNGLYSFAEAEPGYTFSPQTVDYTDWSMVGTFQKKEFEGYTAKTIYYVSNDDDENGVIKNAKKVTIAPMRAYFVGPSIDELLSNQGESGSARINILIDGEESGLHLVVDDPDHSYGDGNAKAYTLFGTEAGEDYRGLMIRNGKKVMMR